MMPGARKLPPEAAVLDYLGAQTGLHFPLARRGEAVASIIRVQREFGIPDPEQFMERLGTDQRLFDALVGEVTVGETYFFRDPAQLDAIRNVILPALARARPADALLRIWSAGCSTGEEPYSLAILLEEEGLSARASILATDLSGAALRRARRAEYGRWSLRNCRDAALAQYFAPRGDRFALADRLRARVRFERLNLASELYPSPATGTDQLDLILCRNVLIYFGADRVKQVASRLYASLADGGWLVAGASDPPLWSDIPFTPVIVPGAILYRKDGRANAGASVEAVEPSAAPRPALRSTGRRGSRAGQIAASRPVLPSPSLVGGEPRRGEERKGDAPGTEAEWVAGIKRLSMAADLNEAEQAASEALLVYPLSAQLHFLLSVLLIALGREEEAAASLRRLLYLDRTLAAGHFTLGILLQRRGEVRGARRSFNTAYRLCAARPAAEPVELCDGETAGSLAEAAKARSAQLRSPGKGG